MLAVEEILLELERDEMSLPPGFRFHPTDEELITFYLASKVFNGTFCGVQIAEVDLNRCEPWELPDVAKMGEREWYFFSLRDRKYPTGLRTNRATGAGYWKATGKDREVYSNSSILIGMKKTLVFYKGRAPRGEKTKWVMHEYRLDGDFSCRHTCKEEWVICRIFHKLGERKISPPIMFQPQNYLTTSLPPLLEPSHEKLLENPHQDSHELMQILNQNLQNPFSISIQSQESDDLKSLINPIVSQCDPFSVNISSFTNPINITAQNQDLTLKELSNAIAKQCKKETFCSRDDHFGVDTNWQQRIQDDSTTMYQINPLMMLGWEGCFSNNEMGIIPSSSVVTTTTNSALAIDHVMSTEPCW